MFGTWKLTHGHQMEDGTWHLEDGVRRQEKSSKGSRNFFKYIFGIIQLSTHDILILLSFGVSYCNKLVQTHNLLQQNG